MVLGVAQDGGYPQAACRRECCERARAAAANRRHVAALAVVDPAAGDRFLFDATPDLPEQLELLDRAAPVAGGHGIAGILLTHAHIGHYLGLAQLGREVMGTWDLPVYAMPRMRQFLRSSGPWDLLVRLRNIEIRDLSAGVELSLTPLVRVTPVLVPHRDEYSETVGFRISGPERTVLYVPDIDKWDRWDIPLRKVLAGVDVAYLDGTFFDAGEVQGRDASEIPHPLIRETIERLNALPPEERAKVHFIHMNHTNPALDPGSEARARILEGGFRVAEEGERVDL
jgi:pyrroloquinoline quinone biosynthesis protein B